MTAPETALSSKTLDGFYLGLDGVSVLVDDVETSKITQRISRKHLRVHEKQYCEDSRSGSKLLKELKELTFLENGDENEDESHLTPIAVQGAKTLQEAADREIDKDNPNPEINFHRVVPK